MGDSPDQAKALADFLARHVKAYDPTTDGYERPPFAADIKEGKNDPIYSAHSYHTKVPPRSIIPYILHYTQPGDLVLDLFCGSGMTGVAAQMCAKPPADILEQFPELKDRVGPRACILNDLSPAACHIAYNYNTPVDVRTLKQEFERIKAAVKDEFDWLYGTEHYEPAVGLYDPANAEVASRLKNPPGGKTRHDLLEESERTWELLTKAEVEKRLGYPVTELPRDDKWGDLDLAKVKHWVCIPATIQYTIWSDVYRCEGFVTIEEPTGKVSTRGKNVGKPITAKKRVARGCGRLFDLWSVARNHETGEVTDSFSCPFCTTEWTKLHLKRVDAAPVVTNYLTVRLQTAKGEIKEARFRGDRRTTRMEQERIQQIESAKLDYWIPANEMDPGGPQYRRSALNVRGIKKVVDFWTSRNRRAFASLWHYAGDIQDYRLKRAVQFLLTSFVARVSRKSEFRESGGAGNTHNLTISSITREDNLLKAWGAKEKDIVGFYEHATRVFHQGNAFVRVGSATALTEMPDSSVDYVFTDPPFGSNIYYSEPNLLWEVWLGQTTEVACEAVVHRKNDGGTKRLPDYARIMAEAFKEMFRVLKPGRWATVEFNNSDGAVFEAIKQGVRGAGFEIANMLLLDKEQKTFKQIKGAEGEEDVVDKDVLFNLHKPAVVRTEVEAEDHDLEQQVADAVRQHLQTLPERIKAEPAKYNDEHRTTATINSMLMNTLIPRGISVERLNLPFIERVCARYFRKVGQRWYLRGEAVGGNGGGLVQEEVTIKDELSAIAWLRQKLESRPTLIGELKPLWMRATGLLAANVSQLLILEDLLTENFWRDADTNRWREPTAEERERMNDDRSLRVLHDAERFVNNTLDLPTTDEQRCQWIEVLFQACRAIEDNEADALPALRGFDKAEAYSLIPRLFQSILRDHVSKDAYTRAEKQARAASQRVAKQAEQEQKAKAKARPDANQTILDFGG
ncbi:MAG TPA: DNA methyltransferase [Verrucomicrobiota bacterium]|nr:DNA methyltransferase [Verrucomicrobiota bacterium]